METKELKALGAFLEDLGIKDWGFVNAQAIQAHGSFYANRPRESLTSFEAGDPYCLPDFASGYFLSFAFPYLHQAPEASRPHFSVYCRSRDYHGVVKEKLAPVLAYLEALGRQAKLYVDDNELPERLIAALSGLGDLGRNGCLITPDYGSYVFLGEIWTDLPLGPAPAKALKDPCKSCRICQRACPAQVLKEPYILAQDCLSYVSQKKTITLAEGKRLGNRLFGCDTCQMVCPYNQGKDHRGLEAFSPLAALVDPDLEALADLSKQEFYRSFKASAAGWRGKRILQRNALQALANQNRLPLEKHYDSPALEEYYQRLLAEREEKIHETCKPVDEDATSLAGETGQAVLGSGDEAEG